eukprot:SAG22_NODE_1527_length_4219_cov_8.734466_2_plen_301_part_00
MVRRVKTQKFGKKAVFIKRGGRGGSNIESSGASKLRGFTTSGSKGKGKGKGKGKDGDEAAAGGTLPGAGVAGRGAADWRPAKGQGPIKHRPDKWSSTTVRGDMGHALRLARSGGVDVKSRANMPAVQELGPMLTRFKKRVQPRHKDYNGQGLARESVFIQLGQADFMDDFAALYAEHVEQWSRRHLKKHKSDQDLGMEWRVRLQEKQRREAAGGGGGGGGAGSGGDTDSQRKRKKQKQKQKQQQQQQQQQQYAQACASSGPGQQLSCNKLSSQQDAQGQGAVFSASSKEDRKKKRYVVQD